MARERARELRRNSTDAERKLWACLRAKRLGGYKFRRQYPVGQYVVDFVCVDRGLVVEVDGDQHADRPGTIWSARCSSKARTWKF